MSPVSTPAPNSADAPTSSQHPSLTKGAPRQVLVSGASGFVGSTLCAYLSERDWLVRRLVRHEPAADSEVWWDPGQEKIADDALLGVDAVVHLAGESVNGRWTRDKKDRILQSRVRGTRLLAQAIDEQNKPPKVFVSVSAVGYYGHRGDEILEESSPPASDFLADVCKAWEAEAYAAANACRVVCPRLGIVFGPSGGALQQMAKPFQLGLGGALGNGQQFMSWISLRDLVRLFEFVLEHPTLSGPVNAVAPSPVTNEAFTRSLADHLRRPALARVPAWALRLGLGEFAGEVLGSKRVLPVVASKAGFVWQHPTLEQALAWSLPRT